MTSTALSSLLGLAPPPVIAPSAVEKRLSKNELRVATAAFHRARGYGDRIDFARFRDTVLHEAFGVVPLYVAQRLFMVWNFAGGSSTAGALTLKEFLVGVTIAWKGTRDEQLKLIFQLMDRHGSQELTKRDTLVFLRALGVPSGIVAVESTSGKRWTMEEFLEMLYPSDKTVLTPTKFVKTMTSRPFSSLALIEWIPRIAVQFEREKEKLTAPAHLTTASTDDDKDSLMDTIMVKLRRINSGDSFASTTSSTTPPSPLAKPTTDHQRTGSDNELSIIQVESINPEQFQELKRVLAQVINHVLASREVITHDDIRDRLLGVVSNAVLQATQETAAACARDFLLSIPPSRQTDTNGYIAVRAQNRARLLWWIVCICCSFARSSTEVFRYLFVLFDEDSQGYWTRAQLTTFIRCVDLQEEEQSSEVEAGFLAQTVFEDIMSRSQLSGSRGEDPLTEEHVSFRYRDFEKYLAQYPIPGCSATDMNIIFTLLHADLSCQRHQQLSHRAYLQALQSFCEQLIVHEVTTQLGFCLLHRRAWERLVEWMCDYDAELPLVNVLKREMCTLIEEPQALIESIPEVQFAETAEETAIIAVPISLWLVLATKLHERKQHTQEAHHTICWTETVTILTVSTPAREDCTADEHHREPGAWTFCAVVAAINLTIVARDGSECVIDISDCIVDREVTLQTLVQTAISLHGRERASVQKRPSIIAVHPKGAFFCEGEVLFSNPGKPSQKVQVSQDILLIPLSTLDEGTDSRRMKVSMNVLLTDERSNSHLPRWQSPMLASPASSQRSGASTPSSRTPRSSKRGGTTGWTKVHGLANLGNTCFMNSALQCLSATPILRDYFLRGEHLYDLSSHAIKSASESPLRPGKKLISNGTDLQLPKSSLLPVAFGQLLAEMNAYSSNGSVSGMADVISPKYLKTAIATLFPHLSDGTQQDAQEFLSSLLSSLSDELKRLPVPEPPNGSRPIVSSPSLMARFASFSRNNTPATTIRRQQSDSALSKFQFQVSDSNGRCDRVVAKEWWISHLIAEPSIITALFCGQFKSTLQCTQCGNTSTRFEPFSSLQLPLMDETTMLSPRSKHQNQQVVVVLHFLDSPCYRPSLRLVLQVGLDWTAEQLLIKIQQDHATYSSSDCRRDHIAVTLSGFTIEDYIDPDALLTSISTPINVFEIEYGDQARAFGKISSPRRDSYPFELGAKVLARASHERWVKAVIERPGLPAPDATDNQPSVGSIPLTYHLYIEEAGQGARVCLGRSDIRPRTAERFMLLRFLHRRPGLVPFYSTSPYRQVICGFPFICRLPSSMICGRGLYHMVHRKFASSDIPLSDVNQRRSFVLKRVRSDGKCCDRCHWTDHCDGCKIDRLDEEPLDLEMDETIAIDWALDTHEPAEEWLTSGCRIEDHESYTTYKHENTHSLGKSLQILCSEEHVEARCSHCTTTTTTNVASAAEPSPVDPQRSPSSSSFVPHTKSLALWSLPPILVIQLKRFELVAERGYSWQRLNHSVDFLVDGFDMAMYLASTHPPTALTSDREEVSRAEAFLRNELQFPIDTASRTITSYRLYGLVNHVGTLGGGHYTAHIRHPDNADWWLVDDASATPANPQTLSPSSSAYLLFYVRDDVDPTAHEDEEDELERELTTRSRGLFEFYPRQPHTCAVSDAAVRSLCKQDFWQRLPTTKTDTKRDDTNCTLM